MFGIINLQSVCTKVNDNVNSDDGSNFCPIKNKTGLGAMDQRDLEQAV